MKIKQLVLSNIGSYEGQHIFSFDIDDPEKNIILIGGRNGTGKTTLFDSIRLCLYGNKLFGYRQNSQTYINKVKRLINDKSKREPIATASVRMEILIEDGFSNSTFEIQRAWELSGKHIKEDYSVQKDRVILNADECTDFDNFILQTIPPALFDFHFFNGENISNFLFDNANGQNFRKAFMQICGLDTFDLLEDQLGNNVRVKGNDKSVTIQQHFESVKTDLNKASNTCESHTIQINIIQGEIEAIEEQLAELDKTMSQYGGVADSELLKLQNKLKTEENKRDEKRHYLKDTANNIIPFIILTEKLVLLQQQLVIEEKLRRNRIYKDKLLADEVKADVFQKLKPFLKKSIDLSSECFFDALYAALKEDCDDGQPELLRLSEDEHIKLLAKIQECTMFDVQGIIEAENEIEVSLGKAKKLRASMDAKEAIDPKKFFSKKSDLMGALELQRQKLFEEKTAHIVAEETKKAAKDIYEKVYEEFRLLLKEQSVTDMASRVLLAFQDIKQRLYLKYVALVEKKFATCFSQLISKTDLLDGIYISSLFEVVAYKQADLDIETTLKRINTFGKDFVKSEIGERAYSMIENSNCKTNVMAVPLKVEQHFSAGEQQIFVMALYQSLTAIRTAELPFVIDTPLARIDSQHRKNILLNFFANLPGQVIILSTDEEVDVDDATLLQKRLSDVYLIEHQGNGASKATHNTYFKEALN